MRRRTNLLLSLLSSSSAMGALPKVDLAKMGTVGVAGSFAGLDLYDPSSASFSYNTASSTLFIKSSNGSLQPIGQTNAGGSIVSACTLSGKLYVAGSFTSLANVQADNVASYDPSSGSFATLGGSPGGLDGAVSSLYCDSSSNTLWAAGAFHGPSSQPNSSDYGGDVARYTPSSDSWSPAPFYGLTGGQVLSISPSTAAGSLLFSGNFVINSGSLVNTTLPVSNASNPNVPQSSGATPFSSSLVPVPLTNAEVIGQPSSNTKGFGDIKAILCPAGPDGAGNTWLARDGNTAQITVRAFQAITASGIRLGNTFVDGRGTKAFYIRSIPDNALLHLSYIDPTTKQNMTCFGQCPLLHDPSVPYQDFLFSNAASLTGFQLTIDGWAGAGPGLHILQLLSSGAFASASAKDNTASCYAPGASKVDTSGTWKPLSAWTSIAATTQDVLVAQVPVGTTSGAPSLTWTPYVSASGVYDVSLLIPGCQDIGDCANRTSVKVTLQPGGGLAAVTTTISEQVDASTSSLIYSGPIYVSAPDFTTSVTLTLADQPTGNGVDGKYDLIADRVEFVLVSAQIGGTTTTGPNGVNGTATGAGSGLGFYEYQSGQNVNATGLLANTTLTPLDALATAFKTDAAAGGSIAAVAQYADDGVIFGGSFTLTNGGKNFAAFSGGSIVPVNGGGLDGVVVAMVPSSDLKTVYVAGSFNGGIVAYNVAASSFSPLGGGVDGPVSAISLSGNVLEVVGKFTRLSNGASVGGIASFDLSSQQWSTGGLVSGSLTMATDGYVAGNVANALGHASNGWAILEDGKDGEPLFVQTSGSLNAVTSTATTKRRSGWFGRAAAHLGAVKRQAPTTSTGTQGPAVYAGAYWTDSSTSNEVVILGGNFSVQAGSGLAVYDTGKQTLNSLPGNQVQGIVQALYVSGDELYVGGNFAISGVDGRGFAMYDLKAEQWSGRGLQGASGANAIVSVIGSTSNNVLVGGSFAGTGSVACEAICAYDTNGKQWSQLGQGIHGSVAAIDYAGDKLETIVVAGTITLADGTAANVAAYSTSNSTWTALGSTPGPVTALSVNNQNMSNIFAAGRSSDGNSPFLIHWDGSTWTAVSSSWAASTTITQLKFVPLQDTHSANSVIESDRMLFISGSIDTGSSGVSSSTLYDGQSFYPYLTTSHSDGTPGSIFSLFTSYSSFSFNHRKFLATGIVILISLAIATGIVFLIVLIGVLWTLCSRRSTALPEQREEDEDESSFRHRPSSLLQHINAATLPAIIGASAFKGKGEPSQDTHDQDGWRAETPSAGMHGMASEPEDVNRPTHARYSFAGGAEGELPVAAGQEVVVLDDRDQAWWYVRDPMSGKEGVVPASYLY